MDHEDAGAREKWIDNLACKLVCDRDEAVNYVLDRARVAAADGTLAMPGMDQEESRAFNATLRELDRIGVQVPAPDGVDDEGIVGEARALLAEALREQGLPAETEIREFTLGVGVGTGAAIIATVVGLIVILKDGPAAWANVSRWSSALKKALSGDHVRANVETLKLICVDDVLRLHPDLKRLDPKLIAATVAVRVLAGSGEQETLGAVYVIVPVAEVNVTYVYAVTWNGSILHRAPMPFFGEDDGEIDAGTDVPALGSRRAEG